jgi:hypothetical protein
MAPPRLRRLSALFRLLAVAVALLQGAVPAAAAVAEGVLALRGRANPVVTHIEDARTNKCAYVHPADCGVCSCLATTPMAEVPRAPVAASPERLVPAGVALLYAAVAARAPPTARGPPAV